VNVLLVDDEEVILKSLEGFLTKCGHQVQKAENGREALSRLDREVVDVVVSDIRMPQMTGLELLGVVRVRHPGVPVVLMTGHGDVDSAVDAFKQGAADYLRKPVRLDDVVAVLDRLEGRKRLETSLLQERERLGDLLERTDRPTSRALLEIDAPNQVLRTHLETLQKRWDEALPTLKHLLKKRQYEQALSSLILGMPLLISEMQTSTEQIERWIGRIKE
jgi:YesN/AraC family two-component response regulator